MIEAPGYRRLLALPGPRRLALGAIPADLADWLDYAAIVALLVFTWREGPFVLALFALALILPYILVGPVLVALLHRLPVGLVLVASNLGRAVATAALIFAGDTAVLLAIVFLRSSIDSVFTPARQSAIQATTPEAMLPLANGIHQAVNQASKIAGPALGGLLLGIVAPAVVFGINAGLSLLAAAIMASIAIAQRTPAEDAPAETFVQRTLAGLSEFRRNRVLRIALAFVTAAYFAFYLYDALIALLADEFGFDSTAFGLSIAASGLGGVVAALVAGRFMGTRPMRMMAIGAGASAIVTIGIGSLAVAGSDPPLWLFFIAIGFMGGATALMLVPYRTIIQSTVEPDRIARVFAAGEALAVTVMVAAPFIGSAIATAYGTGMAFIAGGVLLLILAVWTLASRPA